MLVSNLFLMLTMLIFQTNYNNFMIFLSLIIFMFCHMFMMNTTMLTTNISLVDSISQNLVYLTIMIIYLMLLTMMPKNYLELKYVFIMLLFILTLINCFLIKQIMYFYFFFEASLIPTILLILGWGYQIERLQASLYLLVYTIFASLPLLLIVQMLEMKGMMVFYLKEMESTMFSLSQYIMFGMMNVSFFTKTPFFFFHLWLPKAHVEAPASGSMILAAILLKLGGYGLIRMWKMNLTSINNKLFLVYSLVSMMIVALICVSNIDLKMIIAYSSIAHMMMGASGYFSCLKMGEKGLYLMLLSHGVCSSGMFFMVGVMYKWLMTRTNVFIKGLETNIKAMSIMMFLIFMPNMGIPMTMNMFSEIFLIMSFMKISKIWLTVAILSTMLVATYTMLLYSLTCHGKVSSLILSTCEIKLCDLMIMVSHVFVIHLMFLLISFI